ncbi:MAG TPA: Trp biosynthesis-associated membrane protein [Lacisediminihabitans sp.]|uniref:Trp biosynthesis-associated membrane protein n=1 Tax=Lacisediminihabitans sp. TaxID=2787631 RepID=UPI002EDB86E8
MRGPRGLKNLSLIASILLSGLTLLGWTGQWYTLRLGGSEAGTSAISVGGDVAAPGLIALALAGLALVAALAIAGPFFRVVLGLLQALIGFTIGLSSILAIHDPVHASAALITSTTGVSGRLSIARLVVGVSQTAWPWFTLVVGALTIALGVVVLVTGRRWPGSSRRYQPVRLEPADGEANAVSDWDTLSGGSDPTSR